MPCILDFKNVTVMRGETKALDRIDLNISSSQNTAIVGPNGSGKSTLLKLIARELYPVLEAGSWSKLFGAARWNVWDLRQRLGIVSLDLQQLFTEVCVARQVVLSGFVSTIGHVDEQSLPRRQIETANQWIQRLGITEFQHRPLDELSTGQQRRCLLARALVNDPEVLVFDEPTVGLDLPGVFQYLETVDHLIAQGRTVIQVTHHIDEIPPAIDNVVLLRQGVIFAKGKKSEVLTSKNLSGLFGASVKVVVTDGFYRALPG